MAQKDRTDIAVPLMRRNFVLNVINGAFSVAGTRAADPGTVVPLLVLRLVHAEWAVGLTQAVQDFGRVSTQLLAARVLDNVERKRPIYIWGSVARVLALSAATAALLLGVGRDPRLVLGVLLAGLFVLMLGNGVSELAWMDITARSVPSTRRGSLLSGRRIFGLILSVLIAAPLVDYFLSPRSPFAFPANYGVLFVINTAFFAAAWTVFSFVHEPSPHAAKRRLKLRHHFARGLRIYRRDDSYRGLLWLRFLSGLSGAVPIFFIAFASRDLGLPERWAALFLTIRVVSEMAASLVFGRMSDRIGNRSVIIASSWIAVLTFLLAELSALTARHVAAGAPPPGSSIMLLSGAFFGLGLLATGRDTGEFNYMLDIAPAAKRPSYIGFGNAFMLPLSLLPVLVGWLAPRSGYVPIFAAAALVSVFAIPVAMKLPEPREALMPDREGGGLAGSTEA